MTHPNSSGCIQAFCEEWKKNNSAAVHGQLSSSSEFLTSSRSFILSNAEKAAGPHQFSPSVAEHACEFLAIMQDEAAHISETPALLSVFMFDEVSIHPKRTLGSLLKEIFLAPFVLMKAATLSKDPFGVAKSDSTHSFHLGFQEYVTNRLALNASTLFRSKTPVTDLEACFLHDQRRHNTQQAKTASHAVVRAFSYWSALFYKQTQ